MPCYTDKMAIKIEDIVFWLLILGVIALAIWKLFGSPTDLATIITIASLIAGSEITIWKKIYCTEKKAEVGFIKVRGDLNLIKNDIGYIKKDLNNINNKLNNLEN